MAAFIRQGRLSLLWRTLLLLTVFVAITQIGLYLWIQRSVTGHFEQMDAEVLTHTAFNLRQLLMAEPFIYDNLLPNEPLQDSRLGYIGYDVKAVITDQNGQILTQIPKSFSSLEIQQIEVKALWQQHHDQQFDLTLNQRHYRAIVIQHKPYFALIVLPIDIHHHYLLQFNQKLIAILIAITIILVFVAALSVHLGFAPLTTIRQKMRKINADQLDDRIVVSSMPSELRALADAYNAMMANLERNFEALSRFSDDIAHELRTPLATLSTQTEVMLSKPRGVQEYIEQLHHQHGTITQLANLINNMLLLAKTQKGRYDAQFTVVDVKALIIKVIDYYEFVAEDRKLSFDISGNFKTVLGDKSLLERLFSNLISNAIYYAAENSVITITAKLARSNADCLDNKNQAPNQNFLNLTISNQLSAPMSQQDAEKLSERFYRHDKQNPWHSGSGLGLSIVQAIVNAHHGQMRINIKNERCFEVSVLLPILNL